MRLAGKRILVTGGSGFVGGHLLARLARVEGATVAAPSRAECDLLDGRAAARTVDRLRPEVVFHLAAEVGGIGANRRRPATFLHNTALMGLNVIDACRRVGVGQFVLVGSVCAYPEITPVPFRETDLWNGYPEPTNAPYGVAKRLLITHLRACRAEFGFPGVCVLPANLYGPGDHFDLQDSHVVPALVRKFVEAADAGAGQVEVWGTGRPTREFLYVEDAVEALVLAAERLDDSEPVNVGSGHEITIADLAGRIARLAGFTGAIRFRPDQPDGQPRRALDLTRAGERLGFRAGTSLEAGLARTIAWFRAGGRERPSRPAGLGRDGVAASG